MYKTGSKDFSNEAMVYGKCMQEIVFRMDVITKYWNTPPEGLLDKFHIEYICLQFRTIFELILLSSLVHNEKYYDKGKAAIGTVWRPNHIDKLLTKINSEYFPVAMVVDETNRSISPAENGYITKEELLLGFDLCGDYLHAWNPYSTERDYQLPYDKFKGWATGINKLLLKHLIKLKEVDRVLWVELTFDETNQVNISYMQVLDNSTQSPGSEHLK
jgi:hypothetical protein